MFWFDVAEIVIPRCADPQLVGFCNERLRERGGLGTGTENDV